MSSRPILSLFPLFLLASICLFNSPAEAWEGVVIRVIDGDTLVVAPKTAKQPEKVGIGVRLYGIDAPEMHHPGGKDSKAALEALAVPGAPVEIIPVEADRYDRSVGLVLLDGVLLNLEQIRNGNARVDEKYCRARYCGEWKRDEKPAR